MILYFTLKLKLELEMLLKTCESGDTNICMICVACSFERKAGLDDSPVFALFGCDHVKNYSFCLYKG